MQYSIGVEYALHCLLLLIGIPPGESLGIRDIAAYLGTSDSYLSKVFTKLAKANIVSSMPGVKGGYQLARDPSEISFWDVVEAIEGTSPLFRCTEVRRDCVLFEGQEIPDYIQCSPCTIKEVMGEAEQQMRAYLQGHTLAWLLDSLKEKLPEEHQDATARWVRQALMRR